MQRQIEFYLMNMITEAIQGASVVYGELEIYNQVYLGHYQIESFTISIELEGYYYFFVDYQGKNISYPVMHSHYYAACL
ncbi:hypothetical protein SteCoe_21787 [Stentor coeruleus]|uniref:Uncharacterized protein n=1 Tax=Stentor coeruleus TaxID=5963 RepID=A0A1R2BNY0_9CILI|nr:hypothetical protein SteCoe_21787 [Stentor coeruleus]